MSSRPLEWKTDETLAVGKGATVQQFIATLGEDQLQIDIAPWGEGHIKVNGREGARVNDARPAPGVSRDHRDRRALRGDTHD